MLGELFYIARKRAGYSQSDAASQVQITQPYLSMIEHNHCTPRAAVRDRLCALYDVTPDDVAIALTGRTRRGRCHSLLAWLGPLALTFL